MEIDNNEILKKFSTRDIVREEPLIDEEKTECELLSTIFPSKEDKEITFIKKNDVNKPKKLFKCLIERTIDNLFLIQKIYDDVDNNINQIISVEENDEDITIAINKKELYNG